MRLGLKMAILCLAVSLVPLGGAGLLILHVSEQSITKEVKTSHERIAHTAADLTMDYLKDGVVKLETVALLLGNEAEGDAKYISKAKTGDNTQLTTRLNDLVNPQEAFTDLQYWSTGTRPVQEAVASQAPAYNGQFANNWAPQQQVAQGKQSVDDWMRNRTQNPQNDQVQSVQVEAPALEGNSSAISEASKGSSFLGDRVEVTKDNTTLVVSAPVRVKGDILGVLVAHMNLAPLTGRLASAAGEGRSVALFDDNRSVIATSGDEVKDDAEETTVPAGHANWSVVVREPKSAVYAPLAKVRMQAWIWLGVAAALALFLALGLTVHLARPISALTRAAEAMRKGELAVRSEVRGFDELGRLGSAFDSMAEALQALDRAKNEFLSHVSHELRTPLTSMQLSVGNLLDGTVGTPSDEQTRALARIRADVERLIRMVNELLDIARIEAGKVSLRTSEVDLTQLVKTCVESIEPVARQRGLTITFEGNGVTPRTCDAERLQQVVLNLLDNAIKFTPSGGSVVARVEGNRISVRDTGIGISKDQLRHIFEPFHQVPQADGSKYAGAGLGLSIARRLVLLHRGIISVTSEPGHGSEFTVVLP